MKEDRKRIEKVYKYNFPKPNVQIAIYATFIRVLSMVIEHYIQTSSALAASGKISKTVCIIYSVLNVLACTFPLPAGFDM